MNYNNDQRNYGNYKYQMNKSVVKTGNSWITIRTVLTFLALFNLIIFFCPIYSVSVPSLLGELDKVAQFSTFTRAMGNKRIMGQPIFYSFAIVPIVITVLLYNRKLEEKKAALYIAIFALSDLILWYSCIKLDEYGILKYSYSYFEKTKWYALNVVTLLLIAGLSALVSSNKVELGAEVTNALEKLADHHVSKKTPAASSTKAPKNQRKICPKCGSLIEDEWQFCISCGTPITSGPEVEDAEKNPEFERSIPQEPEYM